MKSYILYLFLVLNSLYAIEQNENNEQQYVIENGSKDLSTREEDLLQEIDQEQSLNNINMNTDNEVINSFEKQIRILQAKDKDYALKLFKLKTTSQECKKETTVDQKTLYAYCRMKYDDEIKKIQEKQLQVQLDIRYMVENQDKAINNLSTPDFLVEKGLIIQELSKKKLNFINEINIRYEQNLYCIKHALTKVDLKKCEKEYKYE